MILGANEVEGKSMLFYVSMCYLILTIAICSFVFIKVKQDTRFTKGPMSIVLIYMFWPIFLIIYIVAKND